MNLEREVGRLASAVGDIHAAVQQLAQHDAERLAKPDTEELGDSVVQMGVRTQELETNLGRVLEYLGSDIKDMKERINAVVVEKLEAHHRNFVEVQGLGFATDACLKQLEARFGVMDTNVAQMREHMGKLQPPPTPPAPNPFSTGNLRGDRPGRFQPTSMTGAYGSQGC